MINDIELKKDIISGGIPEEELNKLYKWLEKCPWHCIFEGAVNESVHLSFISKEIIQCPKCEDTGIVYQLKEKPNYYGPNEGEVFEEEVECEECQ